MLRRYRFTLILLILLFLPAVLSWAEEEYYPYPIIFIHGIDPGFPGSWDTTIAELKQYFYNDDGTCKYFDYGGDYLIALDYEKQNNGDIPTIARTVLKPKIDGTIAKLPEGHKKVIIVAHSMGGLVVRSLLKQYPEYQDKIEKVVFVGTPHLGAPAASAVSILKKLNETTLKDIAKEYSIFYSASLFTGFRFRPTNCSDYVFSRMAAKIMALKTSVGLLLKTAKECPLVPDPDGIAVGQLRVAGDVNYHATLKDFYGLPFIKEEISLGHSGSETFLGQDNLDNPSNYKTIRGINAGFGKPLAMSMNFLLDNFENNFTFPFGQSLSDAANTGDGIVTQASQEGIGAADYTIDAFHTDEPKAVETILKALDDKPVIESVEVAEYRFSGWGMSLNSMIKIKIKDYMSADIEIAEIIIDGKQIDLNNSAYGMNEYYDEETGKYKPYKKYGNSFLKEHEGEQGEKLKAGEFEMRLWGNKNYIKIRNAAGKMVECIIYRPYGIIYPETISGWAYGKSWHDGEQFHWQWNGVEHVHIFREYFLYDGLHTDLHTWQAVKEAAYDAFLNDCDITGGNYPYYFYVHTLPPGNYIQSKIIAAATCAYIDVIPQWKSLPFRADMLGIPPEVVGYEWRAWQNMFVRHNIKFKLDVEDKKVRAIKFIAIGFKKAKMTNRRPYGEYDFYEDNLEGDMDAVWDFNIFANRNGKALFNIPSANFETGDKIEKEINLADIDLNGENIIEFTNDMQKCNYIPELPNSVLNYYQKFSEIHSPFLLVTFEDEDEAGGK